MNSYKLTFGIEPTDKYKKAKHDLLQALKSYDDLSLKEKECLMQEFFGAVNIATICNILNQYFR